uniref:DUF4283 domain-containing protein n=1 Tax=Tanacetum cinerariifolium TaxID=118510 RepID=A0A699GUS0_TANCI|nr:hypothetical protein [Tanacetum cinerariifolium]
MIYSQHPLILKKWNPDVNLLKEDVGNVPIWVKLHDVPFTAFSEDDLSTIATKLGTPLIIDSYTSYMCLQSWGRSSYARAMIELQADVELKDTIVVAMPKPTEEGFYTCNVHVEYEWKPPRCACCKRAKVVAIEEAKYLTTLPLDDLVGNLKVYELILENDGTISNTTTKEKVKSLALKVKVTRKQTSDYSDRQGGSDEDVDDEEEEDEALNLMTKNFRLEEAAEIALETKVVKTQNKKELDTIAELKAIFLVCLKCDLLPDNWIVDSGCTKHMTENRRFYTLYKAYDGGHIVFGSNLKGKVVDGVSFTKVDCTISKNGKMLAKRHRRNGLYTYKLGDNSKQQICLVSMVDDSTLWHRSLGHISMREFDKLKFGSFCEQHGKSYNLSIPFTSQSSEIIERTYRKLRKKSRAMLDEQSIPLNFWCQSYEGVFLGYSQTSKAYIVVNKETLRIEESFNVTFDESFPEPKSSYSVEDDRIIEPIVQNPVRSLSLEANASERLS